MIRAWLIFFGDPGTKAWWNLCTWPGFRHVCAAGFDSETQMWVFIDPHRRGMDVLPLSGREAASAIGAWGEDASNILRVIPRRDRTMMPALFGCTGAIKALLGFRSRALGPYGLFLDLLRHGAERVEVPRGRCAGREAEQPDDDRAGLQRSRAGSGIEGRGF